MANNTIVAGNKDLGNNGKMGGIFRGDRHSAPSGGIAVAVEGGGNVLVEDSEPIIVPNAVNSNTTVSFNGQRMKPKEVISFINQKHGGVPIKKKGGVIDAKAEIKRLRDIRDKKEKGGALSSFNKKMKDEWIPMWKIDYGKDATDELINEMVARHYLYDLGYKYYGGVDEIEFVNESKKPKNHFQMRMYLGEVTLFSNPFIYVDDNHKVLLKRTKVEVVNSDTYDTIKKDIKLELGGNIEENDIDESNEQPIKVKAGSVVVTRDAILNDEKHEYNGEMLTNKEILSKINHDIGGGVEFAEGGKIEGGNYDFEKKRLRNEYEKVKHIDTVISEYGTKEENGKQYVKVDKTAPRLNVMADYLVLELEKNGYEILSDKRSGGSYYIEANSNKGYQTQSFRISDHIGRGGIYKPDADFRTFDDIDTYFNKEYKIIGYDEKITNFRGNDDQINPNAEILEKTFVKKGKNGKDVFDFKLKFINPKKELQYIKESGGSLDCGCNHTMEQGGEILFAPNGKQSNLTPEQYKLVRTSQFKAWFGDWENDPQNASKVVDENGEPMVVYHGTYVKEQFDVFDFDKADLGFHFGTYEQAKERSQTKMYLQGYKSIINPYFLNIRELVNVHDVGEWEYPQRYIDTLISEGLITEKEAKQNGFYDIYYRDDNKLVREFLINKFGNIGFDYENKIESKGLSYLVLQPNQIKLADGTNTTFDMNNPNIRFAKGGEIAEHEETYKKWKSLVNMSKSELENFYNSKEGKEAGLTSEKANELGIHSGRESARWIMKMKDTPHQEWTPTMWDWANRQISFISRMSSNKGSLYNEDGTKTRKHTSLLIWGHNPEKFEGGGEVLTDHNAEFQKLKTQLEMEELVAEIDLQIEDIDPSLYLTIDVKNEYPKDDLFLYNEKSICFNECQKRFDLGGSVGDAENDAKKIWESLSDEQRQQLIQGGVSVMNGLLEEYKQNVIKLESEKSELTEKRNKIYEEEKKLGQVPVAFVENGEEVRKQYNNSFDERQKINKQLSVLEVEIRHAKNIEKAFANGGKIVEFEDKKGLLNSNIPSFIEVDTSVISFDEETILADPMPKYIPLMDEPIFKAKGFVFDAIRIAKDTYIVAVNGYKETIQQSRGEEIANGVKHPTVAQQGYVLLTLDQLVLTNDYYLTRAKALAQKKAEEQSERNEAYYDKLPIEQRERHLNQRNFYSTLPVAVKKKVTQSEYEALDLAGKEAFYKPFKKVGTERLTSKLADDRMWVSFHAMYERFLDPTAVQPSPRYANSIVFQYWTKFRDMMQFKIKDIKMQREVDSEQYKKALETSFGDINTEDLLFNKYGILVKRQDGKKIEPTHIEEIESSWVKIQKSFGNLTEWAKKTSLKISHTNQTYVFASKAIGMYVPKMNTIAVSSKYGYEQFANTFAHEVAHYIDNKLGEQKGKRWLTDDYESTAGILAFEFRRLLNRKTESDYLNATKECFARALQQYFAIQNFGENAEMKFSNSPLDKLTFYFNEDNFVNKENFYNVIKPLIEKFLSETGFDDYTPPIKVEQEPIEETKIEVVEPTEKPIEDIRLEEIEKNIEESKKEEAEINAIQDPTKRLSILKESLRKKEELFNQKIQEHFDTVRQANGQPLNDKRNGQATLNKWERQNDAIRGIKESIEKTKRAIEIEEGKIKQVSATKEYLPKQLLDAIDNGTIVQWRKHPNTFFVAGVDKARLVWDNKEKVLAYRYLREITDKDQYKKFAKTYNELYNAIKNNIDLGVKTEEMQKENVVEVTPKNYNIGDEFMLGEDKVYIGENGAFGLKDEVCLYNSNDKSLLKCIGEKSFEEYLKDGKIQQISVSSNMDMETFMKVPLSVRMPNEISEEVSGLEHTKIQLKEIAENEGIDNALLSFKKDLQVKENRLYELSKYEKGKLPSQKSKTKEIGSLEKRIKEVRKDIVKLEEIKSESENEKQTIEVHKPTEVESIADTKSNKVGSETKETKSAEPTNDNESILKKIKALQILANMGDESATKKVKALKLLIN